MVSLSEPNKFPKIDPIPEELDSSAELAATVTSFVSVLSEAVFFELGFRVDSGELGGDPVE